MQILVLSKEGKRGFSTLWSPIPFPGVARISDRWMGGMARKKTFRKRCGIPSKDALPLSIFISRVSPDLANVCCDAYEGLFHRCLSNLVARPRREGARPLIAAGNSRLLAGIEGISDALLTLRKQDELDENTIALGTNTK